MRPICFVSSRITARLHRLRELYTKVTGNDSAYAIVNADCGIDFDDFEIVYLCSPFDRTAVNLIKYHNKIVVDIDPQFIVPPIIFQPYALTVPSQTALNIYQILGIKNEVVTGAIDTPYYKVTRDIIKQNEVLVDLNFVEKSDVETLLKYYSVNCTSIGNVQRLSEFEGVSFNKGLLGFELLDLTLIADSKYCLFTRIDNNKESAIPDTLIDCVLMGIIPIVTSNLTEAKRFVLENNCGIVTGEINNLHKILKEVDTSKLNINNLKFNQDIINFGRVVNQQEETKFTL